MRKTERRVEKIYRAATRTFDADLFARDLAMQRMVPGDDLRLLEPFGEQQSAAVAKGLCFVMETLKRREIYRHLSNASTAWPARARFCTTSSSRPPETRHPGARTVATLAPCVAPDAPRQGKLSAQQPHPRYGRAPALSSPGFRMASCSGLAVAAQPASSTTSSNWPMPGGAGRVIS